MRWSGAFIPTLRSDPAGVNSVGLRLMIRAGLLRQLESGTTAFLPLGLRSLRKLSKQVREEFRSVGFHEWLTTGESPSSAENLASSIRSYKQLPLSLFQFHPLSRLRAMTLYPDEATAEAHTSEQVRRVNSVLGRLGIAPISVQSLAGQKLAVASADGPDSIIVGRTGNYFATMDVARSAPRAWNFAGEPMGELMKIHTPGRTTVSEICAQLKIATNQILKTLVFAARSPIQINWLIAVVRGDHQVNLHKLKKVAAEMGVTDIQIADSDEAIRKFAMGYVGPDAAMKLPDAVLVADPDAAQGNVAWHAGANERDVHVANFNWFRESGDKLADPTKTAVADIRNVVEGDASPVDDGGVLKTESAWILASSERLSLSATFDDGSGRKRPLWLGNFEMDLELCLIAAAEHSHDEHGLIFPVEIAPCSVIITPIKFEGAVRDAAERLYTQLCFARIDTLLDDRDARAGAKFADADLIGAPLRVTTGEQNLRENKVELTRRKSRQTELVPLEQLVSRVRQALADP
jgi:prolyl-tRNA synthetase